MKKKGELWLSNFYIKKYFNSSGDAYNPTRDKKLLISKKEFYKILGLINKGGMTAIPISLFFNDKGLAKLLLGIGKGKRKFDKRQILKEKDWNKNKARMIKNK